MSLTVSPSPGLTNSLIYQRNRNDDRTTQALERLSTGKRINRGSDDPAGLIAAEQLRGELTELRASAKSSQFQGYSLSSRGLRLSFVQQGLSELRGAAVEATGGLLDEGQKRALQLSVDSTLDSFGRLAHDETPYSLQAIASAGTANLVDGDTAEAAAVIESASDEVLMQQAVVAAEQRGLEIDQRLAEDQAVIVAQSLSEIEDAQYAEETSNFVQGQILNRAANMALAYSQKSHADFIGELLDRVDGAA